MTEKYPTLYARRKGVHLIVECPHCKRTHHHGVCSGDPECPTMRSQGQEACVCPTGSGDGHRAAHCDDKTSPYSEHGYILKEVKLAPGQRITSDGLIYRYLGDD